jgi:hypothetical protein
VRVCCGGNYCHDILEAEKVKNKDKKASAAFLFLIDSQE